MRTDNEVLWDDAEAKLRAQERRRRIDRCEELLEWAGELREEAMFGDALGRPVMEPRFRLAFYNAIDHVENCLRAEIAAARGKAEK